jgi:hypothetical protein
MEERFSFDLHAAECAAQAAAIWYVLEAVLRFQLRHISPAERVAFLDCLLESTEAITLPMGDGPGQRLTAEWIAERYWLLIENFATRCRES